MRQHSPQQIDPRPGMELISTYGSGAFGTNVHSLKRMNSGASFIRLVGINTNLVIQPGGLLEGGFSGNPLSMVPFRPEQSPLPWMYVADRNKMKKVSITGTNYLMGVATPLTPPTAAFGPPSLQDIYDFSVGTIATDWVAGGTGATQAQSTQFTETVIAAIPDTTTPPLTPLSYLTPQFPQFASLYTTGALTEFAAGTVMNIFGVQTEITAVLSVSWATTTISKIVYDSGLTGPCTITVPAIAQILPDHIIVQLGTGSGDAEYVQVTGCAQNPGGTFSFRCTTVNNHVATETITAEFALRCYLNVTTAASNLVGTTLKAWDMQANITTGTGSWTLTAEKNLLTTTTNGVRPIQTAAPCDNINIGFQCSDYTKLTSVEVQFDVDLTTNNFSVNYYSFTKNSGFPASGSNWVQISIPITSLIRTGSDTTRTLANVAAIRLTVVVSGTIQVQFSSFWIGGNYGPSVTGSAAPYQYLVVARGNKTGAKSNGSPVIRAGLSPPGTPTGNGQSIAIYMNQDLDPQVDSYDVYRIGGTITTFNYIGTMPNPISTEVSVLFDVFPDSAIASSPQLETDNFQPFPTVDTPKSGVVNVDGTTITWVSGDKFNVNWSQGTQISINGILCSFYQQPSSTTTVELNQVVGQLTSVPYQINQATILGVPLPFLWGPFAQGTASFLFACGDLNQPGVLFLTKGNNPDSGPDILQIEITSPTEPLINGCMYDGTSFVWSSDRLFRLYPLFGQTIIVNNGTISPAQGTNLFTPIEVPNGKGLFAPWGLAVGKKIRFIGRDGIYATTGGEPELLTGIDWAQLFPHEGHAGIPVTLGPITIQPPDFTQVAKLRLSEYDSCLYFDFQDIAGQLHTLVLDDETGAWSYDEYTPGVSLHYGEEGQSVHSILLGGNDGNLYIANQAGEMDGDDVAFGCSLYAPVMTEGTSKYQTTRNAYLSLLANAAENVTLGMQMDQGPAQTVLVPATTAYDNVFTNMPAMKGKLQSWYLDAAAPFTVFMRDAEFGLKPWGSDGAFHPVDPFASLRRPQAPRSS